MSKSRLSASVDTDLLEAGRQAVEAGRATNLSTWVNDGLRRQVEHDRRMAALDEFIDAFEAQHGEISQEEMNDAVRQLAANAIVVRSGGDGAA